MIKSILCKPYMGADAFCPEDAHICHQIFCLFSAQDFDLSLACALGACSFEAYHIAYHMHGLKVLISSPTAHSYLRWTRPFPRSSWGNKERASNGHLVACAVTIAVEVALQTAQLAPHMRAPHMKE